MTVINYNELDNYLVENPNTIVYVSVLEDETMRYVNGNPVELQKVEPQKLAKGGKERERVK